MNMNKFKLRAECYRDVDLLIRGLLPWRKPLKYTCELEMFNAEIPELSMVVEIETQLNIEHLRAILRDITDSHVMDETLAPADQYTGERRA